MKAVPASMIAMIVGWALPLAGMAIGQLVTSGRTTDVVAMAFWVGLFSLIGWAIAVVPVVVWLKGMKLVSDLRWSWFGWATLGVVAYELLVVPVMESHVWLIVWYPALMGCIAGLVFALLVRTRRDKKPAEAP